MKFLLIVGAAIAAVALFFSGSLPYTLVSDQESLQGVKHSGDVPIAEEILECQVDDKRSYVRGATFVTTFKARLRNNTNRFVTISTIGEVSDPSGSPLKMHSQILMLSPDAVEETQFTLNATFTTNGYYGCDIRYTVGRFTS